MANQIGKNQYGIYDLDKIKQALGEKEWEAVLRPFQYVRMATAAQLEEATGLSRQVVARTLKALLAVEDVAQDPAGAPPPGGEPERVEPEGAPEARVRRVLTTAPHRLAYRAYHTKPATVYLLGQVGAALLRELGLVKDLRACEESRPLALAHSLCILDVILLGQAQGQTALRAEKELANGQDLTLRADVALPQFDGEHVTEWRLLAIEQGADERNADRVERQVERWHAFFAGRPGAEPVSPGLLVLFNLKPDALPAALAEWRNALAVVGAKGGEPRFELRYRRLADFLETPEWSAAGWARSPRLLPEARPAEPAQPAPAGRDPLAGLPAQADLKGLFAKAQSIYALSRDQEDMRARYSVPAESLRALRAWLDAPEMAETKKSLRQTLGKLSVRQSPVVVVNILNKVVWDVLLRQFGVDRQHIGAQGEMQIAAVAPELSTFEKVGYADYHVRVALGGEFLEALREPGALLPHWGKNNLVTALEWLLGAPYTYAYELGLRDQAWLAPELRRSKKDKK